MTELELKCCISSWRHEAKKTTKDGGKCKILFQFEGNKVVIKFYIVQKTLNV